MYEVPALVVLILYCFIFYFFVLMVKVYIIFLFYLLHLFFNIQSRVYVHEPHHNIDILFITNHLQSLKIITIILSQPFTLTSHFYVFRIFWITFMFLHFSESSIVIRISRMNNAFSTFMIYQFANAS